MGDFSAIAGGIYNGRRWPSSMIVGGENNAASGDFSFASGRYAQAVHDGAFVWADPQAGLYASTLPNQFSVRGKAVPFLM